MATSKKKNAEDLHHAVRAFVEGNGGKLSVIGPIEIVPHKPLVFDLVIHCVGQRRTSLKAQTDLTNRRRPAHKEKV